MHLKIHVHQKEKSSKDIFLISLSVVAAFKFEGCSFNIILGKKFINNANVQRSSYDNFEVNSHLGGQKKKQ